MRMFLRRIRTWTIADYATVIESLATAAIVEAALRFCSIETILGMIETIRPGHAATALDDHGRARLSRFAAAPYRLLSPRLNCLRHSLVLCAMLRRRGAPARLCIGVERQGDGLAAHAWVDVPDLDRDGALSRFHELPRAWSA
jgi:hypothetical protein